MIAEVALVCAAIWLIFAGPLMLLPATLWSDPGKKKWAVLLAPYVFAKMLFYNLSQRE